MISPLNIQDHSGMESYTCRETVTEDVGYLESVTQMSLRSFSRPPVDTRRGGANMSNGSRADNILTRD